MTRGLLLTVLSLVFLISACSKKAEGPNMKEGKWEITIQMEATGKMPFQMPPQTFTQCITKDKFVPEKVEATNQQCKTIKQELKGDTVSWLTECQTPDGKLITEGTITYKGTTFDGVSKIKHGGMEITQKMNGKWIGECK
ncbi:DUF3617 family protein [Thermodesulfovibrio sp.]|uniref:DUF3617 domain-containing protein n=1 Tax=Thermodesulfovibrio sp. TaxID=2067987 RepID=UPI003095C02D